MFQALSRGKEGRKERRKERNKKRKKILTSPDKTVQFEMKTSLEFHVLVPSVLTELWELVE